MNAARTGRILSSFSAQGSVLTWTFHDGTELVFHVEQAAGGHGATRMLSQVAYKALLYGFKQKIADAGAMLRDPKTGLPPPPELRIARMRRMAERLAGGNWELERAGGESWRDVDVDALLRELE